MKSESIDAYDGAGDVLTPYLNVPDCTVGEFSARGVNPTPAGDNSSSPTQTQQSGVQKAGDA